jgi:hypothetical protein
VARHALVNVWEVESCPPNHLASSVPSRRSVTHADLSLRITRYKQGDAMTIELSDMRFFVEALRHGSITRASLELDIPKSSGSRRITRMKKELGVQLVKRTTRKVNATPIGKAYFERCVQETFMPFCRRFASMLKLRLLSQHLLAFRLEPTIDLPLRCLQILWVVWVEPS